MGAMAHATIPKSVCRHVPFGAHAPKPHPGTQNASPQPPIAAQVPLAKQAVPGGQQCSGLSGVPLPQADEPAPQHADGPMGLPAQLVPAGHCAVQVQAPPAGTVGKHWLMLPGHTTAPPGQPQTLGVPPPPHVVGGVHVPQLSVPPQPSGIVPQFLPCAAQVVGVQQDGWPGCPHG
jgi:hypothetical protein